MQKLFGNTKNLKANQKKQLESLYKFRINSDVIISNELAIFLCNISFEIYRQIGILVNRQGKIDFVIVGSSKQINIPDLSQYRKSPKRLRGLQCIHTHLYNEPLSNDDLTDLVLLRLDLMSAITVDSHGNSDKIHTSHILAGYKNKPYNILPQIPFFNLDLNYSELIKSLESELAKHESLLAADYKSEKAILVSITTKSRQSASQSLIELSELSRTCDITVVGEIIQQRKKVDSRFLIGSGKLNELAIFALSVHATLLIFDQELNPSQIRSITNKIELKVIDRTQLILDIFAQRAQSKEGKLQVELAQLKYLLPRLTTKNTAMSRLTGGIGGRGPGETKLEINRRRVRERILRIEKALKNVIKQRRQQKAKRNKKGLPIISVIGYTNAGKSTLLNTLTKSNVLVENKLFATLDPSSRRLKFPKDIEVILTDTVGFIKNLPKELIVAFRATLEELESADLLLHVVDISNINCKNQFESVLSILDDLKLNFIKRINVLNKMDLVDKEKQRTYQKRYEAISISANNKNTLMPLINKMENFFTKNHLAKK